MSFTENEFSEGAEVNNIEESYSWKPWIWLFSITAIVLAIIISARPDRLRNFFSHPGLVVYVCFLVLIPVVLSAFLTIVLKRFVLKHWKSSVFASASLGIGLTLLVILTGSFATGRPIEGTEIRLFILVLAFFGALIGAWYPTKNTNTN